MCVTNIYTDHYPDGQENQYRQHIPCPRSSNGRNCAGHHLLEHVPRSIQYGEPTSAQMFSQTISIQTPPTTRSSTSSTRPILESDDGTAPRTAATYSMSSGGRSSKSGRGSKSRAMLDLFGVKLPESEAQRKKRKDGEARKKEKSERIVYRDVYTTTSSSPPLYTTSSPPQNYTYARPAPAQVRFADSLGVPYSPSPRQQPTIITRAPDTPPTVVDAVFNTYSPANSHQPTTRNAYPRSRSVSPVTIPERDRRPHYGPAQPPLIVQHQQPPRGRSRSPSPPALYVRAPTPPPEPPTPAFAIPIGTASPSRSPSGSRSQSQVRPPPINITSAPLLRRESSRGRRPHTPEPSIHRDTSRVRRRNEEIRNRPAIPLRGSGSNSSPIERERRPYVASAPVVEQSRRFNDAVMSGGLGLGLGQVGDVNADMMDRLRERHEPLGRRNTVSGVQSGGTGAGAERRRERHEVLYDDGVVRSRYL